MPAYIFQHQPQPIIVCRAVTWHNYTTPTPIHKSLFQFLAHYIIIIKNRLLYTSQKHRGILFGLPGTNCFENCGDILHNLGSGENGHKLIIISPIKFIDKWFLATVV